MIIVKRAGHKERFDERKLYASIYAACMSMQHSEKSSEKIASEITRKVKKLIFKKENINSNHIRKIVISSLKQISKEISFAYEHHLPNLRKL